MFTKKTKPKSQPRSMTKDSTAMVINRIPITRLVRFDKCKAFTPELRNLENINRRINLLDVLIRWNSNASPGFIQRIFWKLYVIWTGDY
jgi:hypothetical protein